jgi:integrase
MTVTVDLEGVYKVTAKGRTYYYAWRGKGAPRLTAEPGTDAFVKELAEARAGRRVGDKSKVAGLVAMFRASDPWNGRGPKPISAKTRASWAPWLDRIQRHFGPLSVAQFDRAQMRPRIVKWRDGYAATPRAADMGVQVLSRLLSFAQAEGLLLNNICNGVEGIYASDRSGLIWEPQHFAALAAAAGPRSEVSREILEAAELAALTGLRQSVLLRLGPAHRQAHCLEIRSNKGRNGKQGRLVTIPLYAELRAFLDALPRRTGATTYLVNTEGRPWSSGFGSSWAKACDKAPAGAIDHLHFHDLRGTAATRFYRAGLTPREIAEIMGWAEDYIETLINRYVKRDEILLDRIRRMDAHASRTDSAKPAAKPAP